MTGWWTEHAVPHIVDLSLGTAEIHDLRARVCAPLAGTVVELGFGSGLNARHYPTGVERVHAVEPSDRAWRMAAKRVRAGATEVDRAELDGQRLDLPDASADAALSTFTMCTIPDLDAALAEVGRVLRAGGLLCFAEHGLSPDPSVARWQHRLTPLQRRVAGGCHLDREITAYLRPSGLALEQVQTWQMPGPRAFGYVTWGRARRS